MMIVQLPISFSKVFSEWKFAPRSRTFGAIFHRALGQLITGGDALGYWDREWREAGLRFDCDVFTFQSKDRFKDPAFGARVRDWEVMYRAGISLLERIVRDQRLALGDDRNRLSVRLVRKLPDGTAIRTELDGLCVFDGRLCVTEWKTVRPTYRPGCWHHRLNLLQLQTNAWVCDLEEAVLVVCVRSRRPAVRYECYRWPAEECLKAARTLALCNYMDQETTSAE